MKIEKKVVLSCCIGNILEFYDFALYSFFANIISELYFPAKNPINSLILFYGVFAVGFLSRPIGAIFFGFLGDRLNRVTTLSISLLGVAIATFFMGILPTYSQWGILAPIILMFLRVIQGISLGGEYSNSLIFVSEHMKKIQAKSPSFATGIVSSMGLLGWFLASYFSLVFTRIEISLLCWRIPFLFGSVVGLVGIYLRTKLVDAFPIENDKEIHFLKKFAKVFRHPKEMSPALGVGLLMGALFYGQFIFEMSFLPLVANISKETAAKIVMFGIFLYMVLLPIMGLFADRVGHKKVVFSACILCIASAPALFIFEFSSSLVLILLAQLIVAVLLAGLMGPGTFLMSLFFPRDIRCLGVSFSYNLGAAVIGGMVPSFNLFLYKWHKSPIGPACLLMLLAFLATLLLYQARTTQKIERLQYP